MYCCKCCCKKLVTFCLTQSGYAEKFVSSLRQCLMHWRLAFTYELTHFGLAFSRLNSLTRSSCFSHFVSLFSSSVLCSISSHSPWPFPDCESCIYAVYYSYQSRDFLSSYLPCTKLFLSIFHPTRTILKEFWNLPSIVCAAHSKLGSSANLEVVLLICLSVLLMKSLSCINPRAGTWTTGLIILSVWKWVFCKDSLWLFSQPCNHYCNVSASPCILVWSTEHQIGQCRQPDCRQDVASSLRAS